MLGQVWNCEVKGGVRGLGLCSEALQGISAFSPLREAPLLLCGPLTGKGLCLHRSYSLGGLGVDSWTPKWVHVGAVVCWGGASLPLASLLE